MGSTHGKKRLSKNWPLDKTPLTYLHADSEDDPCVLVNVINFNRVVDLLLRAAEEAAKGVDEFVVNGARAQVVALVLHDGHLGPLVLLDFVLLDRVEALLAAEAAKDKDIAAAHRDGVRVP